MIRCIHAQHGHLLKCRMCDTKIKDHEQYWMNDDEPICDDCAEADSEPTQTMRNWFGSLSEAEKCCAAVDAVAESGANRSEITYACSKPWKYIREAYLHAHKEIRP